MNIRPTESAVIGGGVAYLLVLTWMMANTSYDLWGALIVGPPLILIGAPMLRRLFSGAQRELYGVMLLGLVVKLCGGMARYWVSFDAYGGSTDAQRYHNYGVRVAQQVWSGDAAWSRVLPYGTGTAFVERFTALVYTFTGTSRLAGFFVFAWISFWGVALFVKSAVIAVPGLARRRYASIVTLAPSVVFWPASIGKEALMFLTLGVGTFGIARLLSRSGVLTSLVIALAGLAGAAFVRPHIVGVWLAGLVPGLLVVVVRGRSGASRSTGRRGLDIAAAIFMMLVALVGLGFIARATVDYLAPTGDEASVSATSVGDILTETTRRTSESGSTFTPPDVSSPADWPIASVRTILRPLPTEARGAGQLLAAAEIVAFVVLCVWSWKRVKQLPRSFVTNPYVAFAITTLLLGGLAYASFANLGVLTRQKSLIFPFLLLIPCLPDVRPAVRRRRPDAQKSSISPSDSSQFERGGRPLVAISRQVRMGPPPGSANDADDIWGGPIRTT
jgi:hypothetical protein